MGLPDATSLRRLRFDLEARADESVPGAIARGVAGHHLLRTRTVLREAGAGRRAGLAQLADDATVRRVAYVVRTDPAPLVAQTGRRLKEPGDRRLQHFIDFGGLVLPRAHLELHRRRISPLALRHADQHRQPWLMSLLPFCPQTLERLVDTCQLCGFALGWVESVGIGRCECCFRAVPPNPLPGLADGLAESYRLFAGLLSLQPAVRERSVAAMPERLRTLAPGELARLTMRCGLDCAGDDGKRAWQTRAGRLGADRITETAVRGIDLLLSWPTGIADWAAERMAAAADDKACRHDLRVRIRRIAWGDSGFRDQRDLLDEVFPGLEPAPVREMPGLAYTGRETDRRLPGFRGHAAEIRKLGIVPHRVGTDAGGRSTYLYSAAVIDAAARAAADAVSIASIAERLQLPVYGIEQLFGSDLLARRADPLLMLMLRRPMGSASSCDNLSHLLTRRQSRRPRPENAIPLNHESHRIGGRAKPWSDIYAALLSGKLPFWLADGIGSHNLLIAQGGLDPFIDVPPRAIASPVADLRTTDAAEMLNVVPGDVRRLRAAELLPHATGPRAKTTPRADVERLAAQWVSAAEMARRARIPAFLVNEQLRALGVRTLHGLWCRAEALDALPMR